jgi:hypothetical protein
MWLWLGVSIYLDDLGWLRVVWFNDNAQDGLVMSSSQPWTNFRANFYLMLKRINYCSCNSARFIQFCHAIEKCINKPVRRGQRPKTRVGLRPRTFCWMRRTSWFIGAGQAHEMMRWSLWRICKKARNSHPAKDRSPIPTQKNARFFPGTITMKW